MQVIKPVYTTSVKGWTKYGKDLKPLLDALKALDIPPENTKSVTKKAGAAKKKAPAKTTAKKKRKK